MTKETTTPTTIEIWTALLAEKGIELDREELARLATIGLTGRKISDSLKLALALGKKITYEEIQSLLSSELPTAAHEKQIQDRLAAQREQWVETARNAAARLNSSIGPSADELAWLASLVGQLGYQLSEYSELRGRLREIQQPKG